MEATATGTENKSNRRKSRPSYAAVGSIGSLGLILFFLYLMSLQQGELVKKNHLPSKIKHFESSNSSWRGKTIARKKIQLYIKENPHFFATTKPRERSFFFQIASVVLALNFYAFRFIVPDCHFPLLNPHTYRHLCHQVLGVPL